MMEWGNYEAKRILFYRLSCPLGRVEDKSLKIKDKRGGRYLGMFDLGLYVRMQAVAQSSAMKSLSRTSFTTQNSEL